MTHFLLSVHTVTGEAREPSTEEEMRRYAERINDLEGEMRTAGALIFSGRLDEPSSAAVVRAMNGTVQTTDGPFIESKEAIGGFYIIEAPTHDAALEWASKTSAIVGMPIEVRPFSGARQG
jgi:hypothetical protein